MDSNTLNENKAPSKRDDILKAALEIFVNEGYDGTTMEYISQKAEVSKRTLYKHFSNKRRLLEDILIYLVEENQALFNFSFDPKLALTGQLTTIVRAKVANMSQPSHIQLAKIIISQRLKDKEFFQPHLQEILKGDKVTLSWIEKAQSAQMLNPNLPSVEILEGLHEIINGLLLLPMLLLKKKNPCEWDIERICMMFEAAYSPK